MVLTKWSAEILLFNIYRLICVYTQHTVFCTDDIKESDDKQHNEAKPQTEKERSVRDNVGGGLQNK